MGTTTPWVGDRFFARERTPEQIEALQDERINPEHVAEVTRRAARVRELDERQTRAMLAEQATEAEERRYQEWVTYCQQRWLNAQRVQVDDDAYDSLPPRTEWLPPDPEHVRANDRTARRFYRRLAGGRELSQESDGYHRWRMEQAAQSPAMLRWQTAPVDPLTPEEAATVGAWRARRSARVAQVRLDAVSRLYKKGEIRPVGGMTLAQAEQIAIAALVAVENGTAPTYE